jgi:hypothetical protein
LAGLFLFELLAFNVGSVLLGAVCGEVLLGHPVLFAKLCFHTPNSALHVRQGVNVMRVDGLKRPPRVPQIAQERLPLFFL